MSKSPVISSLLKENNFFTHTEAGIHEIYCDEPADVGGSDRAPDPVVLTLAALGACTAMTLKMYYDHKGVNWEQIDVHISNAFIAVDKENDPPELLEKANKGKVRKITKKIYIRSDMDDKSLERAVTIADKCPVNLMMKRSCLMETKAERM
jgi:uncharacterized OsmC-like protein